MSQCTSTRNRVKNGPKQSKHCISRMPRGFPSARMKTIRLPLPGDRNFGQPQAKITVNTAQSVHSQFHAGVKI